MVPLNEIVDAGRNLYDVSYNRVSPYFVPKILINMAAGHISLKYGFKVPASMFIPVLKTGPINALYHYANILCSVVLFCVRGKQNLFLFHITVWHVVCKSNYFTTL